MYQIIVPVALPILQATWTKPLKKGPFFDDNHYFVFFCQVPFPPD